MCTNIKPLNNITHKIIQQNHTIYNIIISTINSKVYMHILYLPFPLLIDYKSTTCENHLKYYQFKLQTQVILLFLTIVTQISISKLNSAGLPQQQSSKNSNSLLFFKECGHNGTNIRTHSYVTQKLQGSFTVQSEF